MYITVWKPLLQVVQTTNHFLGWNGDLIALLGPLTESWLGINEKQKQNYPAQWLNTKFQL